MSSNTNSRPCFATSSTGLYLDSCSMATTSFSIRYRSVRIGFLVEDGQIDDLVSAAGLNTLLWGGIYNPVIPISCERLEFAEQLLNLFSVDVLYTVSENETVVAFKESHSSLRDRPMIIAPIRIGILGYTSTRTTSSTTTGNVS